MKEVEKLVTEKNLEELKVKGYTVVEGVVDPEDCDRYVGQYKTWLKQFKNGAWPVNMHSCIQRYRIAHMETTWNVRLQSKKVFEQIWNTEQLLSSFDAVGIARPPEELDDPFNALCGFNPDYRGWLHCDQTYLRQGLHGYQGAVYLEEATNQDWTLEVIEGSHKFHDEFFDQSEPARIRSILNHVYHMKSHDIEWYKKAGCMRKNVAVPKGGMVLWDSRTVHANARPVESRPCKDRWRFCVFVCMAPKAWANSPTLSLRRDAYKNMRMTTHWPCDDVGLMSEVIPEPDRDLCPPFLKELPAIAKSDEAKMLAGVKSYPGESSSPCKLSAPKWRHLANKQLDYDTYYFDYKQLFKLLSVLFVFVGIIVGYFVI